MHLIVVDVQRFIKTPLSSLASIFIVVVVIVIYIYAISQFHPRPAPPFPRGYCGAFVRPVSPGSGAFANFALPGGRAFANLGAIPELLTCTHVSYQNITTHRVLLEKKQIGSSVKGGNKLKRVVKACSRCYACISSSLIKPKLHSNIGAINVNHRFLVIESNFC